MSAGLLQQLGVGGILILLVLKEVFGFLKTKQKDSKEIEGCAAGLDVKKILEVRDSEGKPLIYTSPAIEKALINLTESHSSLHHLMERQQVLLEAQASILRDLDTKIELLTRNLNK